MVTDVLGWGHVFFPRREICTILNAMWIHVLILNNLAVEKIAHCSIPRGFDNLTISITFFHKSKLD